MMLGPMKKKMLTTGIIAFIVPCILFGVFFYMYHSKKQSEIEKLHAQTAVVYRYVLSNDCPINHVISASDIEVAEVKEISAPVDSYAVTYNKDAKGNIITNKNGTLSVAYDEGSSLIGRKLKIPVMGKTILTDAMFFEDNDYVENDIRAKEFNSITLPSDLEENDFVDIRISFPTGEDFIVVAGKEIVKLGSASDTNTIFIDVSEEEILRLSSAIIESYIKDSVHVYAVKYVNPYQQLFDYKAVDYVKEYDDAVYALLKQKNESMEEETVEEPRDVPKTDENGEIMHDESGDIIYERQQVTTSSKSKTAKYTVNDLTDEEIAIASGLDVDDVAAIRNAEFYTAKMTENAAIEKMSKSKKDSEEVQEAEKVKAAYDLIALYRNKVKTITTKLVENYPVREEVAALIARNPNILETLQAKYNIEALEAERETLIDTSIYEKDIYTGEVKESETALSNIATGLSNQINTQKSERRAYLQNLIRESMLGE